jgi:hypothetical protein
VIMAWMTGTADGEDVKHPRRPQGKPHPPITANYPWVVTGTGTVAFRRSRSGSRASKLLLGVQRRAFHASPTSSSDWNLDFATHIITILCKKTRHETVESIANMKRLTTNTFQRRKNSSTSNPTLLFAFSQFSVSFAC